MLTAIKQRLERDEEEGFTLIELMVVLLIIAILLAIAIPTFLGARNTANARSSQENLRNSLTAEQTNWTNNQSFATGLGTLEPSLTWNTGNLVAADKGAPTVSVLLGTATVAGGAITGWTAGSNTTADGVLLLGFAKDNNCYAIFQSDNATADFTAYEQFASAGGCTMPGLGALPNAAAAAGTSAASNVGAWSASF
jgi:type IV pilus assembly protein PilA